MVSLTLSTSTNIYIDIQGVETSLKEDYTIQLLPFLVILPMTRGNKKQIIYYLKNNIDWLSISRKFGYATRSANIRAKQDSV